MNDRQYSTRRTAEDLEGQNEEHIEGLSAKVKLLKDITINIGSEVRDSMNMLSGMTDQFSEATGLLGGTFRRMRTMADNQGSQFCFWLFFLLACVFFFFFVWMWRRFL